jgi:hypothetical protein
LSYLFLIFCQVCFLIFFAVWVFVVSSLLIFSSSHHYI